MGRVWVGCAPPFRAAILPHLRVERVERVERDEPRVRLDVRPWLLEDR